jgi:uroporphyrinogen III methyltransferase / synthase
VSGLAGKRVLITRPRAQSTAVVERLMSLGAAPVIFPTIEIAPLADFSHLDRAIGGLNAYRWVIFTSANGVEAFWQRLAALGRGAEAFRGVQVAAIGPATARALAERGVRPDFVPAEYVAEAILPGLGEVRGQAILLPRAEIARKALAEALAERGAAPEEIPVYRTLPAKLDPQRLAELEAGVDFATFTSSSTVRNFVEMLGSAAGERLKGAVVACIGPITAQTAREHGLTVEIVAAEYTADGLVDALLDYCQI